MNDMTDDILATCSYGKVALRKLSPTPENFRLVSAGWLRKKHTDWKTMQVTGAEFRVAKTGPNKGKLTILIPGTQRTTYVTKEEMDDEDSNAQVSQDV